MKNIKSIFLTWLCFILLVTQSASADRVQAVKTLEESANLIMTLITKNQIFASVCAKSFPNKPHLKDYAQKFSDGSESSFSTVISVKMFLDENASETTGPKLQEDDVNSYPPVAEATMEILAGLLKLKEAGMFEDGCESLVRQDKWLAILQSQMKLFFGDLEKLNEYFPGYYDFIAQNHFKTAKPDAGQWQYLFTSELGDKYFFEPGSVQETGNIVTIILLNNYSSPNGPANSVVNKVKFDCLDKRFQVLSDKYYSTHFASGSLLEQFDSPMPWYNAPLESSWHLILVKACELD